MSQTPRTFIVNQAFSRYGGRGIRYDKGLLSHCQHGATCHIARQNYLYRLSPPSLALPRLHHLS